MALLRPELEARVREAEERTAAVVADAEEVSVTVDALVASASAEAVPEATFDDPSVVRHIRALERTVVRARRESGTLLRKVASTGYSVTRRR